MMRSAFRFVADLVLLLAVSAPGSHLPAAEDPVSRLWTQLNQAGRTRLGVPPVQLTANGHEIADKLLVSLGEPGGPVDLRAPDASLKQSLPREKWAAERLLRHEVSLLGGYDSQLLGDPIDWFRAPKDDFQWPTHLSRHYWLKPLVHAWRGTHDAQYSGEAIRVLLDWVAKTPLGGPGMRWGKARPVGDGGPDLREGPFLNYGDGPWTSLSAHARVETWSYLLALLADAPQMTNATAARLINSLNDDHRRMMIAFPRSMNQGQGVATSLIHFGWWYPYLTTADEAKRIGWQRMERFAANDIYPDGSLAECSPNYAVGCLDRLIEVAELATEHGDKAPPVMRERAALATRYFALIADPQGRSPRIAKGGGSLISSLRRFNAIFDDPQVAFVASAAKEGKPAESLSAAFPWAGHIVFRSAWDPKATWLFFEPGPRGTGHHDLATLGVQLQSNGEWLLTDPGYYTYSSAGEEGQMAQYLHSTAAHNLALVHGAGQRSRGDGQRATPNTEPSDYQFRDTGDVAQAAGTYVHGFGDKGQIKVRHHRQVTYDRAQDRVLIEDRFEGQGPHRVALHWQLPPEARVTTSAGGFQSRMQHTTLRAHITSSGPVVAAQIARGQKEPLRGWFSEHYGELTPAPTCICEVSGPLPRVVQSEFHIVRH
jgi:hypothetical protein